jgi:hypothetical protein
MPTNSLNPYAVVSSDLETPAIPPEPWKAIAWRWEKLRLFYNLAVGVAGIPALLVAGVAGVGGLHPVFILIDTLAYAFAANVCYLLGPITEMYLNWLADAGQNRYLPGFIVQLIRSRLLTALIWLAGTLGSMLLTLLIAAAMALHNFPAP